MSSFRKHWDKPDTIRMWFLRITLAAIAIVSVVNSQSYQGYIRNRHWVAMRELARPYRWKICRQEWMQLAKEHRVPQRLAVEFYSAELRAPQPEPKKSGPSLLELHWLAAPVRNQPPSFPVVRQRVKNWADNFPTGSTHQ